MQRLKQSVRTEPRCLKSRLWNDFASAVTGRQGQAQLKTLPRLLIVVSLGIQVAACSVTNFRKPVEEFAQATKDTTDALAGLDKQVTDGYADLLRKRVLEGKLLVQLEARDCLTESERCRIVVKNRQGDVEPFPPDSPMRNMLTLMRSIQDYADGLAAIVNADTAAQVSTDVSATVGSLKNLAESVAKLKGPDNTGSVRLADYATPVGNLFNWLAGQYIASVQLDGLRRATLDARPVIAGATDVFAVAANESSMVPRALMSEEVASGIDALRPKASERSLDEIVAIAARYDGLLRGKPAAVFKQLRTSHDALVAKIQDENVSLAEVIARIETFAAEAQALAAIVKELQAVGKK